MESLWPQFEQLALSVPFKILQEQVNLFNSQMTGLLTCSLETDHAVKSYVTMNHYDSSTKMYISSPRLPDYRLLLVQVDYAIAKAYPCEVYNCVDEYQTYGCTANNPEEFISILKEIFHSKEVVSSLQNIMAQTL